MKRGYSVTDIRRKKFDLFAFEGEWKDFAGQPDKSFTAFVYGDSGHGKTSFLLQFSKYLGQFGRVAYLSLEEGFSRTIQMAVEREFLKDKKFVLHEECDGLDDIAEYLLKPKSAQFLIIDSVQTLGDVFNVDKSAFAKFHKLMKKHKKSIIWVSQVIGTQPDGALARKIMFDTDIRIYVENYRAFPLKNRYGGRSYYDIWPEESARIRAEIQ